MPRQRIHHSRVTYQVPHDFPERLERFKEESGLSWAEIIRRLDIHHETMRRWRKGRARPSMRNMMALVALARPLGLGHPLPGLSPSAPVTSALPNESGCIIIEAPLAAVPQGAEAKTTPEGRGREGTARRGLPPVETDSRSGPQAVACAIQGRPPRNEGPAR